MRSTTLQLRSGREIRLVSIEMRAIYADLLVGLPTRQRNDSLIADLVAQQASRRGVAPLLIPPNQTPIEFERAWPFGDPAKLPEVSCVARFRSSKPARNPHADGSELTIIWFQEDWELRLTTELSARLSSIDWDQAAEDVRW